MHNKHVSKDKEYQIFTDKSFLYSQIKSYYFRTINEPEYQQ